MGGSGSKSAETSSSTQQAPSKAVSVKDEVLGLVLDGLMLYTIYQTSKYLYKASNVLLGPCYLSSNYMVKSLLSS